MKESDHFVTLAQEFCDTDQVLFVWGLLPRDRSLEKEFAECTEVKMWESSGFNECANNNVLAASGGSGGSRNTPKNLRQVAFGVATFSLQILSDTSFKLQHTGFLGGQVPGRQTVPRAEPSSGEPSKSSAESTKRRMSKFRLMRSMWREVSHTGVSWNRGQMAYERFPPHACKLFGRCCGRGGSETFVTRRGSGTQSQKDRAHWSLCSQTFVTRASGHLG